MAAKARLNRLEDALASIASELDRIGVRWAIVGGIAIGARAEPRTTRDVDLVIAVTGDSEAEDVVRRLLSAGYEAVSLIEHETRKRLATVRVRRADPRRRTALVDLLFASCGIEREIVENAERISWGRLTLPIAQTGHLIAMKLLARDDRNRPQDWDDLHALMREAEPADLKLASQAVGLIVRRKFHRGRELRSALTALIRET